MKSPISRCLIRYGCSSVFMSLTLTQKVYLQELTRGSSGNGQNRRRQTRTTNKDPDDQFTTLIPMFFDRSG